MPTEREKLLDRLFGDPKRQTTNFQIFRGSAETIDPEEMCRQINAALDALDNGTATELVDDFDD